MLGKCKKCNKPARYISKRFISPLCKNCAENEVKKLGAERNYHTVEIGDFYSEPCIEMENISKVFINIENKG